MLYKITMILSHGAKSGNANKHITAFLDGHLLFYLGGMIKLTARDRISAYVVRCKGIGPLGCLCKLNDRSEHRENKLRIILQKQRYRGVRNVKCTYTAV